MEFGVAELLSLDGNWDEDAFVHMLGAATFGGPPLAVETARECATQHNRNDGATTDGVEEAACWHETNAAEGGKFRCLVGHGPLCALEGGESSCCPPPDAADEDIWELIGDEVSRYRGARPGDHPPVELARRAPDFVARSPFPGALTCGAPPATKHAKGKHNGASVPQPEIAHLQEVTFQYVSAGVQRAALCEPLKHRVGWPFAGEKRLRTLLRRTQEWNSADARE